MWRRSRRTFSLFGAACSSSSPDTTNDPAESADELGGACGGIANLRCKAGYGCSITDKHPDASAIMWLLPDRRIEKVVAK